MRWLLYLSLGVLASGCVDEIEPDTSATTEPAFVLVGNIYQNGTLVSFDDITNVTGIDMTKIVGLTACDPNALYAVEQIDATSYALRFSNNGGQSWIALALAGKSREIACDHGMLVTLDAAKDLWVAKTRGNGTLAGWYSTTNPIKVDRIQGGDGTFYGVKQTAAGYDVYTASNGSLGTSSCTDDANQNPGGCTLTWGPKIATIGASQVTGTGTKLTGSDDRCVGSGGNLCIGTFAWPRRAFALETTGTISTNGALLDGNNLWSALDSGNERYLTLTAAAPNLLYGIQNKGGTLHINRIRIEETSCSDGIDNDANGLTDGEDARCAQTLATQWCAAHADGNYCADRYQPGTFLDQPNQGTSLVQCTTARGIHFATIKPGVCAHGFFAGTDFLRTEEALTPGDPPNMARYCNVQWSDGTWGFKWTGTDPCGDLLDQKPFTQGWIVRAGLYSTTGGNNVLVKCSDGGVMMGATGSAVLQSAYNAVGKTTNRCIFQVSADAYPLFDHMWDPAYEVPDRTAGPFVHNRVAAVDLAQFGLQESGDVDGDTCNDPPGMGWVDRFGHDVGCWRETAYDTALDEGRPLLAPAGGVVVAGGSRVRDIRVLGNTTNNGGGSPNQQELYVKYSLGSDPTYRETWVVYYAHVRKRLVVDGQTVKPGQILGYVGASGATSGYGHLHVGVYRLTNTNAHGWVTPWDGYHVDFYPDETDGSGVNTGIANTVDPLGWANGNGFDPWAYSEWGNGNGAWSANLFKPDQQFDYP